MINANLALFVDLEALEIRLSGRINELRKGLEGARGDIKRLGAVVATLREQEREHGRAGS